MRAPTLTKVHNLEQILSIENDPNFCNGHYYDGPEPLRGLALARMISHKTFVSLSDMEARMTDRCEQEKDEFSWYKICRPLESYLLHQGRKFVRRFDANTYLNLIAAWSQFDLKKDLKSFLIKPSFNHANIKPTWSSVLIQTAAFIPKNNMICSKPSKHPMYPARIMSLTQKKDTTPFSLNPLYIKIKSRS